MHICGVEVEWSVPEDVQPIADSPFLTGGSDKMSVNRKTFNLEIYWFDI